MHLCCRAGLGGGEQVSEDPFDDWQQHALEQQCADGERCTRDGRCLQGCYWRAMVAETALALTRLEFQV